MERLMRMLLGNSTGAISSEARMSVAGLAAAIGLYLTGQPVQAVHLAMTTIAGYAASRGLAKAGQEVGQMMREREVRAMLERIATPVKVVGSDFPGMVVGVTEAPRPAAPTGCVPVVPASPAAPEVNVDDLAAVVARLSPEQLRTLLVGLRKS